MNAPNGSPTHRPALFSRPSTKPSAIRCAASWRARSSRSPTEWDEAGEFPRELYNEGVRDRTAAAGLPGSVRRRAVRPLHVD